MTTRERARRHWTLAGGRLMHESQLSIPLVRKAGARLSISAARAGDRLMHESQLPIPKASARLFVSAACQPRPWRYA